MTPPSSSRALAAVEEDHHGSRITLSHEQARFICLYMAHIDGTSSARIADRGDGLFEITVLDVDGVEIDRRTVLPRANQL